MVALPLKRCVRLALLVAAAVLSASEVRAQATTSDSARRAATLDSAIRANSDPFSFVAGQATGPGWDAIERRSRASRFVVIGERHGIQEIPLFVRAVLRAQRGRGTLHLATENSTTAITAATMAARAGGIDSVRALVRTYPNMLEFSDDDDLATIAWAVDSLSGVNEPIWGLDQEFGALHVLDPLARRTLSLQQRAAIAALSQAARAGGDGKRVDDGHFFMGRSSSEAQFAAAASLFNNSKDADARAQLAALAFSARVYRNNRLVDSGFATGYASNHEREEMLKRRFADAYSRAVARHERQPIVVIKVGLNHAYRALSATSVPALGNYVSEFATSLRDSSFHIAVLVHNDSTGTLPSLWQWQALRPIAWQYRRVMQLTWT